MLDEVGVASEERRGIQIARGCGTGLFSLTHPTESNPTNHRHYLARCQELLVADL